MSQVIKEKYYSDKANSAETVVETIVDDNSDRIFELEKQLHEQYAINNNSNAGMLMSLIGSLLIVMNGYGYVLYQYHIDNLDEKLTMVFITAVVSSLVITLLYCICTYVGVGQRKEQFITFAIRMKYYKTNSILNPQSDEKIYPEKYHPFDKNESNFIQGIYNILASAFIVILFILPCLALFVTSSLGGTLLYMIFTGVIIVLTDGYKQKLFSEYREREEEYRSLKDMLTSQKETK